MLFKLLCEICMYRWWLFSVVANVVIVGVEEMRLSLGVHVGSPHFLLITPPLLISKLATTIRIKIMLDLRGGCLTEWGWSGAPTLVSDGWRVCVVVVSGGLGPCSAASDPRFVPLLCSSKGIELHWNKVEK